MLIPINWVPAFYIAKVSPRHLMASPLSSKIIAFLTCCCLWSSANAGYLKSYFEITGLKVCKLTDAYFSLSVVQRREKKTHNRRKKPQNSTLPIYAWILQSYTCAYLYAKNQYILSDRLTLKNYLFFLIMYELFHQLNFVCELFWKSEAIMCEIWFALLIVIFDVPLRDIVC